MSPPCRRSPPKTGAGDQRLVGNLKAGSGSGGRLTQVPPRGLRGGVRLLGVGEGDGAVQRPFQGDGVLGERGHHQLQRRGLAAQGADRAEVGGLAAPGVLRLGAARPWPRRCGAGRCRTGRRCARRARSAGRSARTAGGLGRGPAFGDIPVRSTVFRRPPQASRAGAGLGVRSVRGSTPGCDPGRAGGFVRRNRPHLLVSFDRGAPALCSTSRQPLRPSSRMDQQPLDSPTDRLITARPRRS
jgi:hypothetical protein